MLNVDVHGLFLFFLNFFFSKILWEMVHNPEKNPIPFIVLISIRDLCL